jgi:hypothetical protein
MMVRNYVPRPKRKKERGSPPPLQREKILEIEERISPLKRFGMTKTQSFYGAAKAAPLQNGAMQYFSAACEADSTSPPSAFPRDESWSFHLSPLGRLVDGLSHLARSMQSFVTAS